MATRTWMTIGPGDEEEVVSFVAARLSLCVALRWGTKITLSMVKSLTIKTKITLSKLKCTTSCSLLTLSLDFYTTTTFL